MMKTGWSRAVGLALATLLLILALSSSLLAQDTPVGPEGTQVGTEETPAAAVNAEELRK
jgi:hypothetical protein